MPVEETFNYYENFNGGKYYGKRSYSSKARSR